MASSVYAKRYAQAVFRMAQESNEFNLWQSDLRKVASLSRDEALFALLENHDIQFEEKAKVLSERLIDINPMALKLVSLLVAKGKLSLIEDISDEYQQLVDSYRGIEGTEAAEVTTAVPLDDEDKLRIAKRVTEIVGRPIVLRTVVDASLIGGIVIRVGDRLIDGSIRNKLAVMKKELGEALR